MIDEKNTKIAIVGLGYVGLPLACLASQHYQVIGLEINEKRVDQINSNICPTDEPFTKEIFSLKR